MRADLNARSQRALHRLHPVAFDCIVDLHVLIILERHAALLPGDDFAGVVLETLELRELAVVHDDIVADQTHIGAALDHAIGDPATRHIADFGYLEDLQDGRVAEHALAHGRSQQAGHRFLHVIDEIVDDVVVADLDTGVLGSLARFLVRPHVEADHRRARGFGEGDVGLGDAADAGEDDPCPDLVEDVKKAMSGLLAPTVRETMLGNAAILEIFKVSKVGSVAGCRVTDGVVERGASVRLIRDNVVVHQGKLSQLKRFKDDAREVLAGQECGMAFENYQDMKVGDVIECYRVETVQRTL